MRLLHAGYEVQRQREKDREHGVKPGERERLAEFDDRVRSGEFYDVLDDDA
jgi:hypothetical protein